MISDLGIKWLDTVTNLEVLNCAITTIILIRLTWLDGNMLSVYRIPKQSLYGELTKGKENHDRLLTCFKDFIKTSIAYAGVDHKSVHRIELDGVPRRQHPT